MKKAKMKKNYRGIVLPLAIVLALVSSTPFAETSSSKPKTASHANSQHEKSPGGPGQIVKEASEAFKATETALKAINNKQPKQALAALEVASGNLHLLLSRDPALNLVPISIQVQMIEGIHDLKLIKKLEDDLEDLVDDGHYQAARPIIDSLVDELRITTVYLPLATYPAAIDQAAPLIDAGKLEEAKQVLIDALSTYVIEEDVTPLAIIHAEEKLTEAFRIERSEDLSKQEVKIKIEKLINSAEQDIKIAQALGYGTKDNYALLYEGIDALKKDIGLSGYKGEWLKLKKTLSNLKNKIVHPGG